MRTTIEIPDKLFREAKRAALERETTLRQLVTEGLERLLKDRAVPAAAKPDSQRLPKVHPKGKGTYTLTHADIDRILAEEEVTSYGRAR